MKKPRKQLKADIERAAGFTSPANPPPAPRHLSPEAKRHWADIVRENPLLDRAGLLMLQSGLEAFDQAQKARKQIGDDLLTRSPGGRTGKNRLLAVEDRAVARMVRSLRAALDFKTIGAKKK